MFVKVETCRTMILLPMVNVLWTKWWCQCGNTHVEWIIALISLTLPVVFGLWLCSIPLGCESSILTDMKQVYQMFKPENYRLNN